MKGTVVTFFDKKYEEMAFLMISSLKPFLQENNLSLFISPEIVENAPPAWNKVKALSHCLKLGFEYVLWIDVDCYLNKSFSVPDILKQKKHIYLVRHWDNAKKRYIPNTGFMILRNSWFTKNILNEIFYLQARYLNHKWWENAAFIHLFSKEDFSDEWIDFNRTVVSDSKIEWLNSAYNSIPNGTGYQCENPYITRFAGMEHRSRLAIMQELSSKHQY